MAEDRESLLAEIERHRQVIENLEERLRRVESDEQTAWPPRDFYTTYYVVVGMIIGIVGALMSFFFNCAGRSYGQKVLLGVGWGLTIWIFNFYLILSWLQPMYAGEALILKMIPIWVAVLTHGIYGLTLGLLEPIGRFVPYSQPREEGGRT